MPNNERAKRWLEKTGLSKDLDRHARKVAKRPQLNVSKMKKPVEEIFNIIANSGVRWPIERELSSGKRKGQYFYDASLVREDRSKIRVLLRASLEELPREKWRPFLTSILDYAREQRAKETTLYRKAESKNEILLHARRANIALGIEMACSRMLALIK